MLTTLSYRVPRLARTRKDWHYGQNICWLDVVGPSSACALEKLAERAAVTLSG